MHKHHIGIFVIFFFLISCQREPGPQQIVSKYLEAHFSINDSLAYTYLSSSDKKAKSLKEFIAENKPGILVEPLIKTTKFKILETKIHGDTATIEVEIRTPDLGKLFGELFTEALALSSQDSAEVQKKLAEKMKNKKVPTTIQRKSYTLVKEQDGWKLYFGWWEQLQAKKHYIKNHLRLRDVKLTVQKRWAWSDEYAPAIFGTIVNNGDKTLKMVKITVYFLDDSGKPISEKSFIPVNPYSILEPALKPHYVKDFGYYLDEDAPSSWVKQVLSKVLYYDSEHDMLIVSNDAKSYWAKKTKVEIDGIEFSNE